MFMKKNKKLVLHRVRLSQGWSWPSLTVLTSDEFPKLKTQIGGTTSPIRRGSGDKSEVGWIGMISLYWPRNLSSTLLENWQVCYYLDTSCNTYIYILPVTFRTLRFPSDNWAKEACGREEFQSLSAFVVVLLHQHHLTNLMNLPI